MNNLKLAVWQLLVQAQALTNVAALIALVGSVLLAHSVARLASTQHANAARE